MKKKQEKIHFKTDMKLAELPKLKLFLGIFLFIFSAISIYSVTNIFRELFMLLSVSEYGNYWMLSDKEMKFYNLFFAFLSMIFAQSITINFWTNRPNELFKISNKRRITIINDNRVLNWYFICWFSKLALLYGLFFGLFFKNAYYTFSFYPNYIYLFILIIIILFLQTWLTLRRVIRKSLKWMALSAVMITFSALGLAQINIIDYQRINKIIKKNCLICRYDLQLPQTENYQKIENYSLTENIFLVFDNDNEPVLIVDNKIIELNELSNYIEQMRNQKHEYDVPRIIFRLNIDKRIKMEFINKLKIELSHCDVRLISYAVRPSELEYNARYYQNLSVKSFIHYGYPSSDIFDTTSSLPPVSPALGLTEEIINHKIILIEKLNHKTYKCNDTIIPINDFQTYISSFIIKNNNYLLAIQTYKSQSFNDFFSIFIKIKNLVTKIRNEYSYIRFGKPFCDLNYEQQDEIKNKYPMSIIDLTEEMRKKINNNILNE